MFRYRCPHCRQVLQALEIRAGKTTICSKCSRPLTIPANRAEWLNERGEPLANSPTVSLAAGPPAKSGSEEYAGDDVLGAIFVGSDAAASGVTAREQLPPFPTPQAPEPPAESPHGPQTRRIPFPMPDSPRASAWLIPPSKGEEARTPVPPAPAPEPEPAAPAPVPPAEVAEKPETAKIRRLAPPPEPPAPTSEEIDRAIEAIREPAPSESPESPEPLAPTEPEEPAPELVFESPLADEPPAAAATPAEPAAESRPDETLVAPPPTKAAEPPPVAPPDETLLAPPTPPVAKPPEPTKVPPREPRRPAESPRRVPVPEPEPRDTRSAGPRHPTRPAPRMEPVPVPVTPPRGSSAREPVRRRVVATTPAPLPRSDRDPDPARLAPFRPESQEEIAVHLTAALATRMKPPPTPPRDLSPATALWLLATGTAIALLILALVTPGDYLWIAGAIGAAELVVGYLWIVWLTFRREAKRGLLCAIPPLTAWYIVQRKYGKFRPLWFAATGLVLLALSAAGGLAQPRTRAWAGAHEPTAPVTPADLSKRPKIEQIRAYRDQGSYDPLVKVLDVLAKTDPTFSEDAKYKTELTAELRSLCGHQHSDVRTAALAAYVRWGGDDARELCLSFVRSEIQDERMLALRLLPRWKDPEVARAVASRIGRPGTETTYARDALLEIGGPAAEQAAIPLLRSDDQGSRLTAIDVLGKVGGADAVAALTELAAADPTVRDRANQKVQVIKARLGGKK